MPPHPLTNITSLKRPRILLRAALNGCNNYRRERHLATMLAGRKNWSDEQVFQAIVSDEQYLDDQRRSGDANYSVSRHVKLMIALVCEAHNIARPRLVE